MQRVLFAPFQVGLGHTSRCLTIASKLKQIDPKIEIYFLCKDEFVEIVRKEGFYVIESQKPIKFVERPGALDIDQTIKKVIKELPQTFFKSMLYEASILKKLKPQLVVSDSQFSIPIACRFRKIQCVIITNQPTVKVFVSTFSLKEKAIEKSFNYSLKVLYNFSKLIFVPDFKGNYEIPKELDNKIIFIGPILKKLPSEVPSKEELRKKLHLSQKKVILVTVGGTTQGLKIIENAISAYKIGIPAQMVINTGPNVDQAKLKQLNIPSEVIVKGYVPNLMEYIKASDIVVTQAGHTTLMEIAACGVPSIIIPPEKHAEQLGNAERIEKAGAGRVIFAKNLTPTKLRQTINNLLSDPATYNKISSAAKRLVKENGAEVASKILYQLIKTARPRLKFSERMRKSVEKIIKYQKRKMSE
ncbi:MAG: UDP-N-acetylglucosamine--N-acetylmuramyl-(pentapeptide) pyrophosphoryl-undecaprenol N-acetylglucosamine transferase [Euryarchaeota archaeon]|nr:UDP-N-acetylglucosamine--N-acetylmuramyl-(pentapeptide) pyrophosphoryl-undecaprenol N-acetylglucosamine transferase [Euryarchaeota archaeon]